MPPWDDEIRRRLASAGLDAIPEAEIAREPATDGVVLEDTRQSLGAGAWQDVRYALRTLRASSGFAAVAILTLALGIGATTAIFSTIDAMLIRPLAYDARGRLVRVFQTNERLGQEVPTTARLTPSLPTFREWQARNQVFDGMAVTRRVELTLLDASPVERTAALAVTPQFFGLFDTAPVVGRPFTDTDIDEPVAIVSYGCWQRRFGGSPDAVGRTIRMLEGSRTIVGVLPAEFVYQRSTDFWIPLTPTPRMKSDGWGGSLLARLKPNVTVVQAQQDMEGVVRQLIDDELLDKKAGVAVESQHELTVRSSRQMLLLLLGAVGCVLLIACVNVASLLVARGAGRQREVVIRASLGAGRGRLLRQLLTESVVLAVLGGLAGAALAWWTLGALVPMLPVNVPSDLQPTVDLRVLGFARLVSVLTAALFGLVPALRLSRTEFVTAVKEGSDRTGGRRLTRGTSLVIVEVALALVLLVGAGLMVRSFQRLLAVDPGFEPDRVLVLEAYPVMVGDSQVPRARAFYADLLARVSALPGVEAVGGIDTIPFWSTAYSPAELEGPEPRKVSVSPRRILPGYFQAMGVPIRLGRDFQGADRDGAPCVAIVNQTLARQHWPDGGPLGRRVRFGGDKSDWCEIVGVAGDVRHRSLEEDILPELYLSALQSEGLELAVVIRAQHPSALVTAARAQTTGLGEPTLVKRVVPFESLVARSVAERRRRAALLSLLGGLGVLLAGVGIFGLTAYAVARRTPEIGIRIALGASPRRVLGTIVGGFVPAIIGGVLLGLFGAWAATHLVAQYLFGITPTDPATLATVSALVVGLALLACYLPARQALRVDPVVALRVE